MIKPRSNQYVNIHIWITLHYGKASKCNLCDGSTAKRFEWALKRGCAYAKDINNFFELCPSCHRKYDMDASIKRAHKSISKVDPLSNKVLKTYRSTQQAIKSEGFAIKSAYIYISLALNKKKPLAFGYKWIFATSTQTINP